MMDSARQIENLVYSYAERLDAGDDRAVQHAFRHPVARQTAVLPVAGGPGMATRLHDDGTPKTKHLTSNVQIYVDDEAGSARSRANYCVTQSTPELPLQIIVTGHYRDTFHRIDGEWWFDSRTMYVDQIGDTSHHLKF